MSSMWSRFTEAENIAFFLSGVVLAGIVSGICAVFRERRLFRNIVVKIKND